MTAVPQVLFVSNVGEWSAFFEELLKRVRRAKGSAYRDPHVRYGVNLINDAATIGKNGEVFPYYKAVDLGRAGVSAGSSRYLIFAGSTDAPIFKASVRSTRGYDITAKSINEIGGQFSLDLLARFREWLDSANEDLLVQFGSNDDAPTFKLQSISNFSGSVDKFEVRGGKIIRSEKVEDENIELLSSGSTTVLAGVLSHGQDVKVVRKQRTVRREVAKLLRASKASFNEAEILDKAFTAGRRARAAEIHRFRTQNQRAAFRTLLNGFSDSDIKSFKFPKSFEGVVEPRSSEAFLGGFGPDAASAAQAAFLNRLVKIPNWIAIAAIFLDVTLKQVQVFRSNTPSRKDTNRFKLLANGTSEPDVLVPESGGELRNSYKLVTDNELEQLLQSVAGSGQSF